MELQQRLELPTLIRKVAVISAADAAGYGDFCDQLQNNRFGVKFEVELFAAVMQGDHAPKSIIKALNEIVSEEEKWDIVVIIRGGGATTDLGCFDDYELASHCAQFPLPILSGIGHTRDMSIVDMVAHTSVKTPTAAAEWLIERVAEQVEMIRQLALRLQRATQHAVVQENNKLQAYMQRMSHAAQRLLMQEQNRLQMWTKMIELHSPERIFKMGYSLTMVNGKPVMRKEDVKEGDVLKTYVQDGVVESVVK
jgi:exodeoxyribonuclease VII large subunit